MILEVEILDASAQIQRTTIDLPLLGLLKHLAIAGQGYMPSAKEYIRTIGMFLHYIEYLSPRALLNSHFSEPPIIRRDPTEKGDFSTIAGKGIADFLCRRISGAKVTFNYEAAMTVNGHKIRGQRPDLYCIGDGVQFAVEAKGFGDSSISSSDMLTHKDQSRRGPLPVHFSIAAISYNIFNKVRCKYYDPVNDKIKFNSDLNNRLLNLYYRGAFEFLDQNFFRIERSSIKDIPCYFIDVLGQGTPFSLRFGDNISFQLILMEQMKEFTLDLQSKNPSFLEEPISGSSFYLDTDGIGFAISPFGRMEA